MRVWLPEVGLSEEPMAPGALDDSALVVVRTHDPEASLLKGEQILLEGCSEARRRELLAGRHAAHLAMQLLGSQPTALLSGPAGEPIWPPGICGSISHNREHAAVLVCSSKRQRSIGLDLLDDRLLDTAAAAELFHERELESGRRFLLETGLKADVANLLFSLKEAIFKCQFPLTGEEDLGFLDVCLTSRRGRVEIETSEKLEGLRELQVLLEVICIENLTIACCVALDTFRDRG